MADADEIAALVERICEEWDKAENSIKLAEQVNGEIINPAVYELRYGGRRLVESIAAHNKGDAETAKRLLGDALFDCYRARHDAIDAATSKMVSDLDIARRKIGPSAILQFFPKFTKLMAMLGETRDKIAISRKDRHNRDNVYASIEADNLPEMVSIYREFQASEPLLKSAARRDNCFKYGGLIGGIVGAMAAIIALLIC